ncbi:hypothetical protein CDAR_296451 [Caerostris darwini]|uniref:Uncharacterized protein n=1 Tax=Caerostris darwini TaxID=1538125 RepID=A0AAV4PK84_9ARAC|nr:hypothetical protein CDAR_296451 [Caerostris darwini]
MTPYHKLSFSTKHPQELKPFNMKTAKLPAPTNHSIRPHAYQRPNESPSIQFDPTHTKDLTSPLVSNTTFDSPEITPLRFVQFEKGEHTYPIDRTLQKILAKRERAANNHGIVSHCIRKSFLVDLMIALSIMSGKRPGTLYTGEVFSEICFVLRRFNDVHLESFEQVLQEF